MLKTAVTVRKNRRALILFLCFFGQNVHHTSEPTDHGNHLQEMANRPLGLPFRRAHPNAHHRVS